MENPSQMTRNFWSIFLRFPAAEHCPEHPACDRPGHQQLQRQRHEEVAAVGGQIVRHELQGKTIAMPHRQNAGQRYLTHHREHLNAQDNGNGPVAGPHHPERQLFGNGAGDKVSAQEDDDKFQSHFLKDQQEAGIGKAAGEQHQIVQRHTIDHVQAVTAVKNIDSSFVWGIKNILSFLANKKGTARQAFNACQAVPIVPILARFPGLCKYFLPLQAKFGRFGAEVFHKAPAALRKVRRCGTFALFWYIFTGFFNVCTKACALLYTVRE